MGVILSKFRKEKTTIEILENLETKIKDIENFSISTQERQKRFVGNFLVTSIGLYVISSIIFYFAFFPSTWSKRISYSTPLLIFPILIIFLKRLVAWFFQRKLNRNANQLKTLRAEKKRLIEQVMDKETYKVALEILNRFGDTSARIQHQQMSGALRSPTTSQNQSLLGTPQKSIAKSTGSLTPYMQQRQQMPQQRTPINVRSMNVSVVPPSPLRNIPGYGASAFNSTPTNLQIRRFAQNTPYPIINQNQKSLFEKVVDYLIGDGPSSRYGMICKECHGHNGMVSEEEYEYSAFKCAFCKALNPARKLRPIGPKLPVPINRPIEAGDQSFGGKPSNLIRSEASSSTSVSDKESSSDSEPISVNETKELTHNIIETDSIQLTDVLNQPILEKEFEYEQTSEAINAKLIDEERTSESSKADINKKNE